MGDPKTKAWLKFYTKWSTYPQVFVNSKFVGGLKIVKEQLTKSELLEMLPSHWVRTSAIEIIKHEWSKSFITIFIKGTPENPKDGYQQELVETLNKHKFIYGYVDVVKNSDLREHMKDITNWKSYPQVFLDGKFLTM